ncbi:MAG: hypothetical protein ACD_3C00198G0001 [uncultured bacterium (gcode 4)]|uniref:DUF1360 domain-containing protein n=1 Tax=uncultured bacterium (gcode 4) TaxID=1234023 RepID=K2G012_9BACT|nr:MAG: hypothetical protein ACD_3C00198G0001 [uncultured bacterium (gcode 4)]
MSIFRSNKSHKEAKNGYFWHISLFTIYPLLYVVIVGFFYSRNIIITSIWFFDLVMLILATFRVTRLFVYDHITDFFRDFFAKFKSWLGKSISELINCPWCTAVWVSMLLVFLYYLTPLSWLLLLILAIDWAVWFLQVLYKSIARWWDSFKQNK